MLRQLGECNRNSIAVNDTGDGKAGEINGAAFVQESVLGAKARATADLMEKMGDPANGTDDLIDILVALRNVVITDTDDLVLAGYAVACASVLLKHLDIGVCKTSLEEVVTTKLLLDVSTVAKLYSTNPRLRVAQHKVQVLLRVEVREQTKPKSSCRNQEFTKTEIRLWFCSGTFSSLLVSVSVPGFKILELPG